MTLADIIVKSLTERPHEWEAISRYYVKHKSGFTLWINVAVGYDVGDASFDPFSWWEKRRIRKAFRYWQQVKPISEFFPEENK